MIWKTAPLIPTFPNNRIDVWRVDLDDPTSGTTEFDILTGDEIVRAGRFHFHRDGRYFSRCRSALRLVLSRYLALPPEGIRFEYGRRGKPKLKSEQEFRCLHFNVSHSVGTALIAVTSDAPVGVDIENIREDIDVLELAEQFFSLRERRALHTLERSMLVQGFFACWTRKEAILKATGEGLSFPLSDFSVSTHPEVEPVVEEVTGDAGALGQWVLRDLDLREGFRAALAVQQNCDITGYQWDWNEI